MLPRDAKKPQLGYKILITWCASAIILCHYLEFTLFSMTWSSLCSPWDHDDMLFFICLWSDVAARCYLRSPWDPVVCYVSVAHHSAGAAQCQGRVPQLLRLRERQRVHGRWVRVFRSTLWRVALLCVHYCDQKHIISTLSNMVCKYIAVLSW